MINHYKKVNNIIALNGENLVSKYKELREDLTATKNELEDLKASRINQIVFGGVVGSFSALDYYMSGNSKDFVVATAMLSAYAINMVLTNVRCYMLENKFDQNELDAILIDKVIKQRKLTL